MSSISVENFIKTIYKLQGTPIQRVKTGDLACELSITNAAVSDMMKKLASQNLVDYKKYQGFLLTDEGERVALLVLRKHRLWETFLHKVLGLSMHEIHREAEELEHFTSDFLANKLDDFLGHPKTDPHGTPIPDSKGHISELTGYVLLSEADVDVWYRIVKLPGGDADFFDICQENGIQIGATLVVTKQYTNGKMTNLEISGTKLMLHRDITKDIYLEKVE